MIFNDIYIYLQTLLAIIASTPKPEPPKELITVDSSSQEIYKWLLDKMKDPKSLDVAQIKDLGFEAGKIYIFKYKPLYKNLYSFWDEHPIILALGKMPSKDGFMNVGVNLSWYPPKARRYIVGVIMKIYDKHIQDQKKKYPGDARRQKGVQIDLYALKRSLDQYGFSFAIRNYLPSQIKNPSYCISFEHWDKMTKLDIPKQFPQLKGDLGLSAIYKDFENHVKAMSNNRVEVMKKTEKNKKLKKYKFIK